MVSSVVEEEKRGTKVKGKRKWEKRRGKERAGGEKWEEGEGRWKGWVASSRITSWWPSPSLPSPRLLLTNVMLKDSFEYHWEGCVLSSDCFSHILPGG